MHVGLTPAQPVAYGCAFMARCVVTIGVFDGVHAGHVALLRRARQRAHAAGHPVPVVVLAFDPHPLTTLRPDHAPPRLTTFEQRAALMRQAGADDVRRLAPTPELLNLTPDMFVERHVLPLKPLAVVEGTTFRFGHRRCGDVDTLRRLGKRHGFDVEAVEPVSVALTDATIVPASSTLARWLIAHGRVGDAAAVLTRPYELSGLVKPGARRGRALGYPTANLEHACLMPGDGVYAAIARLPSGAEWPAAVSVGTKPTFGPSGRVVEAFIMTPPTSPEAVPDAYGWPLTLRFVAFVRDQVCFDSPEELRAQMARDCERIRQLLDVPESPVCSVSQPPMPARGVEPVPWSA